MNRKIGLSSAIVLLSLCAFAFLAQLPGNDYASGQTIPATWTPGNSLTATAQAQGTQTPTVTRTPTAFTVTDRQYLQRIQR